jgi:hypothetical protein
LDSGERFGGFTVADEVGGLAEMRRRFFAFALFLLGEKTGGRGDEQQRDEARTKREAEGGFLHRGK